MTSGELENEGWCRGTVIIVLSNGVLLYASSDSEGNDAGVMCVRDKDKNFILA